MTTTVCVFGFLLCFLLGARRTDGVRDPSIVDDPVRHERHLGAAAEASSALTGDAEAANPGTCTIAARLEPGFDYRGESFHSAPIADAATCASLCADTVKGCVAISYSAQHNYCYFYAEVLSAYGSTDHTRALVNPSADDICSLNNMVLGKDRWGGDISGKQYTLSSATACCILCYSTEGCDSYTYHTGKKRCYLKSGTPAWKECSFCTSGLVCRAANA